MALELLRRGLAVTARGSIAGTDVAGAYMTAEQAAQNQKIGLWSVTLPQPAKVSEAITPPAPAPVVTLPPPAVEAAPKNEKPIATIPAPETQSKIAADVIAQHAQTQHADISADDERWLRSTSPESVGFFERYQMLIAGFLMLATALSITGSLWARKNRDRSDETKAVAAALRGELMGARGVCAGRIKSITNEIEDKAATWPRLRSTLYQAYVGRLGFLGAELARQVASIYGQSSDYASLYSPTGTARDKSKKHALETLVKHIDEVMPKLAHIEQTGRVPVNFYPAPPSSSPNPPRPRSPYDGMKSRAAAYNPSYKAPETPKEKRTETAATASNNYFDTIAKVPAGLPSRAPAPPIPMPVALYKVVQEFIQRQRNAIAQTETEEAPIPNEEHVSEYAAMIEADMEQYRSSESIETFNTVQKKSG